MSKQILSKIIKGLFSSTTTCWAFFSLAFLVTHQVVAQGNTYFQLTEEDGVPSNTVYQILQDSKGYIWLGTEGGLCRFDGNEVEKIDDPILLDDEILQMEEGRNGEIWFLNGSGEVYNYSEKGISKFSYDLDYSVREFKLDTASNNIWLVLEERIDTIFKNYEEKILFCEDLKNCELVSLSIDLSRFNFGSFSTKSLFFYGVKFTADYKRKLYRITFDRLNGEAQTTEGIGLRNNNFYYPIALSNDTEYYYRDHEYGFITNNKLAQTQISPQGALINNIKTELNEAVFLTRKGLMDPVTKELRHDDLNVYSLQTSQGGLTFLGTQKNGMIAIPNDKVVEIVDDLGLSNQEIHNIEISNEGLILIGSSDGNLLVLKDEKVEIVNMPGLDKVNLIEQVNGDLWVVGNNRLLNFFDSKTQTLSPFIKGDYNVKSMLSTSAKKYWLGQNHFLFTRNESLEEIYEDGNYSLGINPGILREKITKLVELDSVYVLGGGPAGVFLMQQQDSLGKLIRHEKIYSGIVSAISEPNSSKVYFYTKSDGLFTYEHDKQKVQKVANKLDCAVYEIVGLGNKVFLATNQGVAIFNPPTQEITDWINKYNGLPSNDINTIALGEDDKLWIGTKKGLAIVDLTKLTKNTTPPPVYITNIKVMEQDTTLHDAYTLPYNQSSIQIDYVGLAYRARGDVRYKYRMKGIDTTWVTTTSRYARFPGLSSGEYNFEVIALNEDDTPSAKAATVYFEITPPYWLTWWFWGACGVAVFGVLGWTFYRRYARLKREQAFEQQISALKMEALQSQMNPHFIFNALNAVQSFITSGEDEQAMFYLAKFAKLIRSIFEYSGKTTIGLDEEIDFLNLYLELERLRFGNKINAAMFVDPELRIDAQDINVPPLLIQPVVENAFKHGLLHKKGVGNLSIKFTFAPDTNQRILCIVEDDGVGRAYTQKLKKGKPIHNSAGLTVTKNRLNILHKGASLSIPPFQIKDLTDQNQNAVGTRVEIIL